MAWTYGGNAVHLSEGGFEITDAWESHYGVGTAADPVAGLWTTSTTTVLVVEDEEGGDLFRVARRARQIVGPTSDENRPWRFYTFDIGQSTIVSSLTRQTFFGDVQGDPSYTSDWTTATTPTNIIAELYDPSGSITAVADHISLITGEGGFGWDFGSGRLPRSSHLISLLNMDMAIQGTGATLTTTGPLPPQRTSVPKVYDLVQDWLYAYIDHYKSDGSPSFWLKQDDFYVAFKDPCVVQVPVSTGYKMWLMFCCRIRVPSSMTMIKEGVSTTVDANNVISFAGRSYALSDIVVFVSDNVDFVDDGDHTNVRGPFLVVDSLEAVISDLKQPFRLSLQVPAAVFTDPIEGEGRPELYVYYVVENGTGDNTTGGSTATFDNANYVTWMTKLDAWADSSFASNGRGIAVKRIFLKDLEADLLDRTVMPTSQKDAWGRAQIAGELLGLVRIWIPNGTGGLKHRVKSFEDEFGDSVTDATTLVKRDITPVKVDPAALWTLFGGIHLFFATFQRNSAADDAQYIKPDKGWGVWSAASIEEGTQLRHSGTWVAAVFGKDFVIRPPDGAGVWADLVVPSDVYSGDHRKAMDPDVFLLPDGRCMVFTGCCRYADDSATIPTDDFLGNPWFRTRGEFSDVAWHWTEAFPSSWVPPFP